MSHTTNCLLLNYSTAVSYRKYVEEKLKNDFKAKADKYEGLSTEELNELAKGF